MVSLYRFNSCQTNSQRSENMKINRPLAILGTLLILDGKPEHGARVWKKTGPTFPNQAARNYHQMSSRGLHL